MSEHKLIFSAEEEQKMTVMGLLKIMNDMLDASRNRNLECMDLTGRQFDIIMYLMFRQGESVSQVDVERDFHMTNPTVSGILKRLESKGFIRRVPSETDKRVKYIQVTERAWEIRDCAEKRRLETDKVIFSDVTGGELNDMIRILRKMCVNIARETGTNQEDFQLFFHPDR